MNNFFLFELSLILDSDENAKLEMAFFFKEFDYDAWFKNEEAKFRNRSNLIFNSDLVEHKLA